MTKPDDIETAILRMAETRGTERTFCPSEIARELAGSDEKRWRLLMAPIKAKAIQLAESGAVVLLRKGRPVDPRDFKGIYRIRRT